MPLARLREPFDHPDWLFELKYDGFRALAHVADGQCSLVSRNGNPFRSFPDLCAGVAAAVQHGAVIDGEIVHLGADGRPRFFNLMRRRTPQHFYAFDLLWFDGRDLRGLPLVERKRLLRGVVQPPMLYVHHMEGRGADLFRSVCEHDMEGIVAKLARGRYEPDETTWVKITNPAYSQNAGRREWFERARAKVAGT